MRQGAASALEIAVASHMLPKKAISLENRFMFTPGIDALLGIFTLSAHAGGSKQDNRSWPFATWGDVHFSALSGVERTSPVLVLYRCSTLSGGDDCAEASELLLRL